MWLHKLKLKTQLNTVNTPFFSKCSIVKMSCTSPMEFCLNQNFNFVQKKMLKHFGLLIVCFSKKINTINYLLSIYLFLILVIYQSKCQITKELKNLYIPMYIRRSMANSGTSEFKFGVPELAYVWPVVHAADLPTFNAGIAKYYLRNRYLLHNNSMA